MSTPRDDDDGVLVTRVSLNPGETLLITSCPEPDDEQQPPDQAAA